MFAPPLMLYLKECENSVKFFAGMEEDGRKDVA